MADVVPFYRDHLTDAQRRRLEILIAVCRLSPTAPTGYTIRQVAQWIATGRWEDQ